MKYQVQEFTEGDPAAERKVVAEFEGEFTPEQLTAVQTEAVANVKATEGKTLGLVPEGHDWFLTATVDKPPEPTPTPEPAPAAPAAPTPEPTPKAKAAPVVGKHLPSDVVLPIATKRSLERRLRNIKLRQDLKQVQREMIAASRQQAVAAE